MATQIFINGVDSYTGKVIAEVIAGLSADYYPEGQKENCAPVKIVGTLLDKAAKVPKCVSEIINDSDVAALKKALLSSTHIAYDITSHISQVEAASWAVQELEAAMEDFNGPKTFICVSSVMTWAKTKPTNPDDDSPMAEDEFRRRRAHPNFKTHQDTEKAVTKSGKKDPTKFNTFVVASGLLYGEGEKVFHGLFKSAWELKGPVDVYGPGANVLPTIHVKDLAAVVSNIFTTPPPSNYLLALDDGRSTLEDIVVAIASTIGNGPTVRKIEKENALVQNSLSQEDFDSLLINLRVDGAAIKELPINWVAQAGFVECVAATALEYKKARNLTALKIVCLGPPGSGKSFLADQLSAHYKLPRIHVQGVIDATLGNLNSALADTSPENSDAMEEAKEELSDARLNLESNGGRYTDELLLKWLGKLIAKGPCRNQGYILDGFPKTMTQANAIFGTGEEVNKDILPDIVLLMDSTDEFLKDRIMALPETDVAGTHNDESGLTRRMVKYRQDNLEDVTVLNYFVDLEVYHTSIAAENSGTPLERAVQVIGIPHNYGLTPEEKVALAASEAIRKTASDAKASEERLKLETALAAETASAQAVWSAMRDEVQRQHAESRDQAALPLRSFLVKNVLGTLTKGLMELCEMRPEDPIDYLAEYLFQNNPRIE